MAFATVAEFLAALKSLRLLTPEQAEALAREALPIEPVATAKALVARGWLTTFQVNELFLGRGANLLLGSYVLLDSVGEGGMGQVFKARNWKLGHVRALKLIRKERLTNPNAIRRFEREIRMAAQLEHPNIVRVYDADEVQGTHFFVMEFVEGTDLHKVVKANGPLAVDRACDYVRQTALGLQQVFERGLVHRDIKPHNLLLVGQRSPRSEDFASRLTSDSAAPQKVKILDLGLARIDSDADGEHSSTMTQEGYVMGTPDYIAPEQGYDSHNVDIRADLYSLGCTFYYLLTGKPPFPGGSLMEKLVKHRERQPRPIQEFRGDVPATVVGVIAKLMAKDPGDRFPTPAELSARLEELTPEIARTPALLLRTEESATMVAAEAGPVSGPSATELLARRQWAEIAPMPESTPSPPPSAPVNVARIWLWSAVGAAIVVLLIASSVWWANRPVATAGKKDEIVIQPPPRLKPPDFGNGKSPEPKLPANPLLQPGPVTDEWLKAVRALAAKEQARAVFGKLKELNPGFDDAAKSNNFEAKDGVIVALEFHQALTDISPVRALSGLQELKARGGQYAHYHPAPIIALADLAPLKGLQLKKINLQGQRLGDLSGLAGMPLEEANFMHSLVKDLTPLAQCAKLRILDISGTLVEDLKPLGELPLEDLRASNTFVGDLSPLAHMPLVRLELRFTSVSKLAALQTLRKLDYLCLDGTQVNDLSFLADKRLSNLQIEGIPGALAQLPDHNIGARYLICSVRTEADIAALERLRPENVNGQHFEALMKIMRPGPAHEAFLKQVAGLAPRELVEAVCDRLGKLNGFPPIADYEAPKDKVIALRIFGPREKSVDPSKFQLTDLTPLEALPDLRSLIIVGGQTLAIHNLWPLRQMRLEKLHIPATAYDLSPLAGMPLRSFQMPFSGSLQPLAGCSLESLEIPHVLTHDISPLAGMPLQKLSTTWYVLKDLAPLKDAPLKDIKLNYVEERHGKTLRAMKQVETINDKPAADFWKDIAEQQVEFVRREMKRLNGELAKFESKIDKGEVVELVVHFNGSNELGPIRTLRGLKKLHIQWGGPKVLSLEPLRGLPLREFRVTHTNVATFAPLQETQFDEIHIGYNAFKDLSLLKGVKVRNLKLSSCEIDDLTPLRGMSVESLDFHSVYGIKDLSPLEGLPLTHLSIVDSFRAKNLTPVGKIKTLRSLDFNSPHVRDLRFLEGLPLERLSVRSAPLADLAPLKKLPNLKQFSFVLEPFRGDAEVLRAIPTFETINGKKAKDFLKEADDKMAEFQKWCDDVAKLPPKEQVDKVAEELKKRNPEMTAKTEHRDSGNQVTALTLSNSVGITDIAPIRALRHLKHLRFNDTTVAGTLTNLYPLKGMNLESFHCAWSAVSDLEALRGMKSLRILFVNSCPIADLNALNGLELTELHCGWTRVSDLTPLGGMKLNALILTNSPVGDLTPLRGMPLRSLSILQTQVSDLTPLNGMPLEFLNAGGRVTDYRVVLDLPKLKDLNFTFVPWRDSALIRSVKTLETANSKPAKEYHAWADWEDAIRAAPPKQQIEMLKTKLIELNGPNSDVSKVGAGPIAKGESEITELYCYGDFKDISPVRALPRVHTLYLGQGLQSGKKSILANIAPLQGLNLKKLSLCGSAVTDLSPLRGMELDWLVLSATTIVDLSPLKGMPLKELHARSNKISSLEPLRGMKLDVLDIAYGSVRDLEPLRGMPLTNLHVGVNPGIKSIEPLAGMKLNRLHLYATAVTDLSVLQEMPLVEFRPSGGARDFTPLKGAPIRILDMSEHKGPLDWKPLYGMPLVDYKGPVEAIATLDFLRSCQATLKTINGKPAAEVLTGK